MIMKQNQEYSLFLLGLLESSAEQKSLDWLEQKVSKIKDASSPTGFFLAFSQASRFFSKDPLKLSDAEKNKAEQLVEGFDPSHWNCLQTARTYLLFHLNLEQEDWLKAVNQLFETGDLHEQAALYAALPLLPFQNELLPRAIDGCRTNMTLVFDAIALNNPFPRKNFPELNWNQMVLKAIFMQRPLYQIQGLEERRNSALAEIASDFAHERWAAGRNVMPELWRLVVPFINERYLADLERTLNSDDQLEQIAGALALAESDSEESSSLLQAYPILMGKVTSGKYDWEAIGREFQEKSA